MQKEELSVIVVDDLQFSREVVKSGLLKAGFTDIRTASSGDEALYLLNQRRAQVVLADFWMPGMNGLEVTDLIRRWDENNDRYTGIVLLTAEDTTSSIVVAFDRGVDDFVSKSANQFELAARVYGAARTAFQQNELREKTRFLSSQIMQASQISQKDPETKLPNRSELEAHIKSLISHSQSRGGGVSVALIQIKSDRPKLRPGTLKTIANSLRLGLRPMDMVARFDTDSFAVALHYELPGQFSPELYQRLIEKIKRYTRQFSDQGEQLNISIGAWHSDQLEPTPAIENILNKAQQTLKPV